MGALTRLKIGCHHPKNKDPLPITQVLSRIHLMCSFSMKWKHIHPLSNKLNFRLYPNKWFQFFAIHLSTSNLDIGTYSSRSTKYLNVIPSTRSIFTFHPRTILSIHPFTLNSFLNILDLYFCRVSLSMLPNKTHGETLSLCFFYVIPSQGKHFLPNRTGENQHKVSFQTDLETKRGNLFPPPNKI